MCKRKQNNIKYFAYNDMICINEWKKKRWKELKNKWK